MTPGGKLGTISVTSRTGIVSATYKKDDIRDIYLFIYLLGQKTESCPFCLKIGTHSISRMIILIPTLVFWISNSKFIFGEIWSGKVKAICFALNLAHTHTHTHPHTHTHTQSEKVSGECCFFF